MKTKIQTVKGAREFYPEWLASHERAHVKQVGRIVKTMQT